jgi:pimeloyl-ACP methyl ester carboxylesterase
LWDDVASRLREAGHQVATPSLRGVGAAPDSERDVDLSSHIDQVVALIERAGLERVVLVGFSYGGFVVTGVASRAPSPVARLVYLDGFVPEPGLSFLDLLPAPVRDAMTTAANAVGDGWRIPPFPLDAVGGIGALESGVSREHVVSVLAGRGFQPLATYTEAFPPIAAAAADIPRLFVSCTDKPAGNPLLALASSLQSGGWDVEELPTGHFAMLSMPAALTEIILRQMDSDDGRSRPT